MRQPGSALRTAATCSFSNAASASPLPFAARIFATTVSTSAIVVSSRGSDCVPQTESVPPPSCRMRVVRREPRKLQVVTDVPERAMVVFAHPDDAEIGSGGVVAKWIAAGCEVTYVLCTNGDAGTTERSLTPAALAAQRVEEQRAAADFMRVKHLVMLGYPDGFLEDTREFLGDVVRAIRQYRPHTGFVHDPYRIRNFQPRDRRKAGLTTTDAVYPFARHHLRLAEQITHERVGPPNVRAPRRPRPAHPPGRRAGGRGAARRYAVGDPHLAGAPVVRSRRNALGHHAFHDAVRDALRRGEADARPADVGEPGRVVDGIE